MKHITIKDAGTEIPAIAWRPSDLPEDSPAGRIYRRAGFRDHARDNVLLVSLADREFGVDPFTWTGPNATTMHAAHLLLESGAYEDLTDGDELDVQGRRLELAA